MSGALGAAIVRVQYLISLGGQLTDMDPQGIMERTILHDVSFGALTQLYGGTAKEGADLNGKVCFCLAIYFFGG
jgi:hypothetical protein